MTAFIRPRKLDTPTLRLAVFHHAGGSASGYFPLTRGLPDGWDPLLVDLPGRGKRHTEPPSTDVASLVSRTVEDLLPWSGPAPLALFGHSLGAIIAFEVAHALEQRGVPVVWLGVSGRVAPDASVPGPRLSPAMPDEELLHGLDQLGGLPPLLHELPDFRRRFLRLIRSDFGALGAYRPDAARRPLAAPVTAFGAAEDPLAPPRYLDSWSRETSRGFTKCLLPGGHFHFLDDSFAHFTRVLVAEMRPWLRMPPAAPPFATAEPAATAV
ncbi:thioesterase II family protein [Streptomyces sp. NPDC087300]|uniref:thioesterase II family protein n=1 Tax=Streptomyces sp. NPDC087300 TaxID=3365780 RepID=UPI00380351A0